MRLLLLDNFDSFTFNLLDYFQQLEVEVLVRRNDAPLAELLALDVDGVVLSPGPGTPRRAGVMMTLLAQVYQRLPVLGVCLGHQALGEFFGAELTRGARPMHGKVSDIGLLQPNEPLFAGLPALFPVTRYHSLVLRGLPAELQPLAQTVAPAPELMALRHRTLPLYGVQFHPEALLTAHGLELLRNWVRIAYNCKDRAATSAATHGLIVDDGIAD
ncbi:aminodeoxychorismate/anthranilate synthase component II [Hymenobacter busanensis]|uniref:Aminodeoxychorismate/anthranilate synthase component II n=1 Tax=Hymenobacter busanensis TaxID=2607656 RepID=A0A7L5A083_9BACT|nr:aminodeoxychorismate/anthranilate synthase component II [Hymenobacter busanensis]KAA9331533.1 aminodeoxychorismate/anthranilate synthase component II [Hymenobacter busanensis]QHJ08687.1 aminodeoxychorismate/anthranilate synthase component II [Hymenobacter busanensis]